MSLGQVDSMVTNETASLCHCVHVLGIFKNVKDGHYVIRPLLSSSIYTYMHDTPLTMYLGVHHNCRSSPRDRLPLQPAPLCVRGGWLQDQGEPPLMPSPLCCLYDCLPLFPPQVWNYKQKRCIFTLLGHLDYIRTTFFHKVMSDACWWGLVLLVMCPAQWVTVHSRVYVMWCIDS